MIDTGALGFALGAGSVAALNPCGFAFLPGYLTLVIAGGTESRSRAAALTRAVAATVAMSAGFVTVFGLFGLVLAPVVASVQTYLPFATVIIGVLLVGLAVWLLAGKDVSIILPKLAVGAPTARLASMYGYGVGYAVASLSCTLAPFLAAVSTSVKQGSALAGILAFVCYAAGMAISVGVAAIAVALAGASAAGALRRVLPYVGRIVGAIALVIGLYVTYYGYYEVRLFFSGDDPHDPVIDPALTVQSWLAHQVDAIGLWPLGTVGLMLVLAFVSLTALRHLAIRRRARDHTANE